MEADASRGLVCTAASITLGLNVHELLNGLVYAGDGQPNSDGVGPYYEVGSVYIVSHYEKGCVPETVSESLTSFILPSVH